MSDPTHNLSEPELETLLVCSFRYALGRRTYIVSDVCGIINRNLGLLQQHTKQQMVRDISDAIRRGRAGDVCDEQQWLGLRSWIRTEHD